jgi:RimJ/RimL family protein N-acetyltransferase
MPEILRLLDPRDAEAFSRLRREAYQTDPEAFAGLPTDEPTFEPSLVAERIRAGSGGSSVIVGAFTPGLVGSLGVVRDEPARCRHKARLWGFYVAPSQRRQALGSRLLSEAVAHGRAIRVEQFYLKVSAACVAAITAYERFGFSVFGREPRALKGPIGYSDELHMVLFLDRAAA